MELGRVREVLINFESLSGRGNGDAAESTNNQDHSDACGKKLAVDSILDHGKGKGADVGR